MPSSPRAPVLRRSLTGSLALLGLCALGAPAHGYSVEVHKDFYDLAFAGRDAGRAVSPPSQAELEAFRRFFYQRACRNAAFRKHWPTEASFDAAAFKELMGLNYGKRVICFDYVPTDRPTDIRTVVREGSVDPDNDHRNQDRLWIANGRVQTDSFGRAIPYDPRTVWFGGMTGSASQFDAHGAMIRGGRFSGSAIFAVLWPHRFMRTPKWSGKKRGLGSAPEFSEAYTRLAKIARLWGGEGSEWLALTFGGNSLHGIEDLGNQIHTATVGYFQFFRDAKKAYEKAKESRDQLPSTEGYVPPTNLTMEQVNHAMELIKDGRQDEVDKTVLYALKKEPRLETDFDHGVRILGNHHRLLERFVQEQYLASRHTGTNPSVTKVIEQARAGDEDFEHRARKALRKAGLGELAPGQTPYGRVLAEVMIKASHKEAKPSYKAIRSIARKALREDGYFDADLGHKALDFVKTSSTDSKHVRKIWKLTGKAFARVVTAVRLWDEVFTQETAGVTPGSPEALARADSILDKVVQTQLDYLDVARERRDAYIRAEQAKWLKQRQERRDAQGMTDRLPSGQ